MRLMSFTYTIDAVKNRTKTVTRRKGWHTLKPGDMLRACEKTRGVPVTERVELANIRVVSVRREKIADLLLYDRGEVAREGFPDMTVADFVLLLRKITRLEMDDYITRIEFEYVNEESES